MEHHWELFACEKDIGYGREEERERNRVEGEREREKPFVD